MKKYTLILSLLILSLNLPAQRKGTDTLPGYIVKSTNDTMVGKVVLAYKLVKEKKEVRKDYDNEQWHKKVNFIATSGAASTFSPADIAAYGWYRNDTLKTVFRSFDVVELPQNAMLPKGSGNRFLRLEMAGAINVFLYTHTEKNIGSTVTYNERFLQNEKGELQPLRIKTWLGLAYNLSNVESWFSGYPGLSEFKITNMLSVEIWMLVDGYNKWRKSQL